ncbi:MAG: T9SS type A sorting domain-containing protein [Melioribacteraceae bacterium]|nr:T9SS type A sorting domain-containing protein [Melioribacteraceae bacterium]MCF8431447.1 T9SS type A sorting domain-containing protein [Melioribacteraceae bacterium]
MKIMSRFEIDSKKQTLLMKAKIDFNSKTNINTWHPFCSTPLGNSPKFKGNGMKRNFFTKLILIVFTIFHSTTIFSQTSDNFYNDTSLKSFWRFYNPVGDGSYSMTGTNIEINSPAGISHDLGSNSSPRILQTVSDGDLALEVKFESVMSVQYQMQGLVVHQDDTHYIRFGTYSTNSAIMAYCAVYNPGNDTKLNLSIGAATPSYLRVERVADQWTFSYSFDGVTFTELISFAQAFSVSEVGVYGGNHNPNPAYTTSVDYFRNLNDGSFSDTDIPGVTPPVVEIWYGDTQNFGLIGNPQKWINILGNVSDANGISSLSYSLNSGASVNINFGPDTKRLLSTGDFNVEIDRADLTDGANSVEITATDALGASTSQEVTLNYTSGNVWSLPYTADWSSISNIEDVNSVANLVDGDWQLTPNGIRTSASGYDRLIVLGDESWTSNYEVTSEFIVHSVGSGSGVGFAIGWQGHEGNASPRLNWPLEGIGWVRNFGSLRILTYDNGIQAQQSVSMNLETKYILKAKSEDIGGGLSRFSVKIWEDGEAEPTNYMITSDITDRDGSVLLITHMADVTWGNISINPITGNQSPTFTSSPILNAPADNLYVYNISASDPNAGDDLTITANTIPGWLTFSDNGNGTAQLSGTPSISDVGSYNVELEVSDGNGGTATQNFTIIVSNSTTSLPYSDQFCATDIESYWTLFDPYDAGAGIQTGESSFGIINGVLEISIPGNEGSHDLAQNLAPRLLQSIPDADFGVEVKFNSVPSEEYQMQGIVVQGAGYRIRFETYFGTEPTFYANGYGVSFGSALNQAIGGQIPSYLRLVRTGNIFEFDYSYDGSNWSNALTKTLNVSVSEIGFYGANHTPNPAFTLQAEYFRNIDHSVPSCSIVELTSPNGNETWSGGTTENILWTSSEVTSVDIEFSADNGSTWNIVQSSVDASLGSLLFNVPNISSNQCLIRITDSDNSGITDISDVVFSIETISNEPTIRIGSVNTYGGATFTIPVEVDFANETEIGFFAQGRLHFDPAILSFKYGENGVGTLLNSFGWNGTFYSAIPGTVDIIISGPTPIETDGVLFNLIFQVKDLSAGTASISGNSNEWPVDVYEKPFTVESGLITYTDAPASSEERGDATLNFIVDFNDALDVLYHFIGLTPLTGQAFINADVNYDSVVDLNDYLTLIFYIYLHDWDFYFPPIAPYTSVQYSEPVADNNIYEIPLTLQKSENTLSAEVEFNFDSNHFEFQGFKSGLQTGNAGVKAFEPEKGKVVFIAASSQNLVGDVDLGSVLLKRKNEKNLDESIITSTYKLNNGDEVDGQILKIADGAITSVADKSLSPKEFLLHQNYPNPFNPTTNISYELPYASFVNLTIYNILGSEIKSLVNRNQNAGSYTINFDASEIPSGIYLYKLRSGNVVITKKMILIK